MGFFETIFEMSDNGALCSIEMDKCEIHKARVNTVLGIFCCISLTSRTL